MLVYFLSVECARLCPSLVFSARAAKGLFLIQFLVARGSHSTHSSFFAGIYYFSYWCISCLSKVLACAHHQCWTAGAAKGFFFIRLFWSPEASIAYTCILYFSCWCISCLSNALACVHPWYPWPSARKQRIWKRRKNKQREETETQPQR